VQDGYAAALARFASMPSVSIDYAVMERSDRVATLPVDLDWNDVGSWDACFEVMEKGAEGNLMLGDVLALDTRDSLVLSGKRLITAIGVSDLLVVETDDAVLMARCRDAQKVDEIVEQRKQQGRREADEHLIAMN
jgi:mannose-1-phosphate guanylyltransferase/mannose-6-phosphate isomerase